MIKKGLIIFDSFLSILHIIRTGSLPYVGPFRCDTQRREEQLLQNSYSQYRNNWGPPQLVV